MINKRDNIVRRSTFKDLPNDWVCPMCYVGKDSFDPVD
ncbi:MAG: rubredoxin [Phycisphaerae bacterium]|nr:rubredoxin [Phycisphaerae bacterium]